MVFGYSQDFIDAYEPFRRAASCTLNHPFFASTVGTNAYIRFLTLSAPP